MNMTDKYFIRAYGCQMNQYEAGVVSAIMDKAGFLQVYSEGDADIVYLITCSVRNHAEQRALGRLNSLRQLKRSRPNLIIGILGCMAQNYKETLASKYGADVIAGPDEYRRLPELINKYNQSCTPQVCVEFSTENYEGIFPNTDGKVTGFISVMRGCNNFCSYCIVPYVRGRERSKTKEQIIKETESLTKIGVQDITLVGQNVLAWREKNFDFLDLIKEIDDMPGFERLRFITSHPKDLTTRHFEGFAYLNKFCPHIHLPLQSGSNRILSLMNRGYTKEEYIEKIEIARKIIPNIAFTTDVMVGFPTETEEDFQETIEVVKKLRFDFAYMFKYSERPNTKSCAIVPKVDDKISQIRLTELINLQSKITEAKSQELLDKELEVLIESRNGKQSYARTKTNKVVVIDEPVEVGKICLSKIIRISGWTPIGKIYHSNNEKEGL